jgi:hypothetical protein
MTRSRDVTISVIGSGTTARAAPRGELMKQLMPVDMSALPEEREQLQKRHLRPTAEVQCLNSAKFGVRTNHVGCHAQVVVRKG